MLTLQVIRESIEYNIFRNRIMNNYYYAPQQILTKQSSQILTPIMVQQSVNQTVTRGSLTDRTQQDLKNSYIFAPSVHIMQPHIVREGSIKHLHQSHINKIDQYTVPPTKSNPIQNSRHFSDYQMNAGVRGEDSQLPTGGGYNITNKIMDKVKNKSDLQKSNSKTTLNTPEQNPKVSSIRFVQSIIDAQKPESIKFEAAIEYINAQILKMSEKWSLHEQRIDILQRASKKNEQNIYCSPQMQEINKILSLVEKSEQRDDYRKTVKMIDQLRVNILDLHSEVKSLQAARQSSINQILQNVKAVISSSMLQKSLQMKRWGEESILQVKKKVGEMQQQLGQLKKYQQENNAITSSIKKFQGKMTTLLYQQKLTSINNSNLTNPIIVKNVLKSESPVVDKQNSASVLTTKTYYIDPNGYLLDKNKYYLVNQRNQQIRLSDKEINLLKKHSIL